jgi:hypothetical protein
MANDEAYQRAKKRGIKKVVTIHPDPHDKSTYMHVYVVKQAGPRGGHTVRGNMQKSSGTRITTGDVSHG